MTLDLTNTKTNKAKNKRNKSRPPSVARGGVGKPVISRSTLRTNAPTNNRPRPGLKLKARPRNNNNNNIGKMEH